jgi:hypothetical protein
MADRIGGHVVAESLASLGAQATFGVPGSALNEPGRAAVVLRQRIAVAPATV